MKQNSGQAMLESLFAVFFITMIMLAFIQFCIMVMNDIGANEAAFTAMRSAAVTKAKYRTKEAKERTERYLLFFNPMSFSPKGITLTDKKLVERFFKRGFRSGEEETIEESEENSKSVTVWAGGKKIKDYGGNTMTKKTVKIYYYTPVIFGRLFPNTESNKRYQSARNRMFPSPDDDFYYKAYPGAKKFKDFL
ncbi:MAG: pilus assembly protein [Elusimicrobiota bacterium]|nr:pilus assembly protein [Elusimicrobiota bacterium]